MNCMEAIIAYNTAHIMTKTINFETQYIREPNVPPGEILKAISCTISPTINKIMYSHSGSNGRPKGSINNS